MHSLAAKTMHVSDSGLSASQPYASSRARQGHLMRPPKLNYKKLNEEQTLKKYKHLNN